jgi:hypothetical protein
MATGIYSWSQATDTTNGTADSAINWAENQSAASVNNSARAMMGVLAKWRDDISGCQPSNVVQTTGGSANNYTLTTNGSIAALTNGWSVAFKASFSNTGDALLAVDGLTAKHIRRIVGSNLIGGEIVSGSLYMATYNQPDDSWVVRGVPALAGTQLLAFGTASGTSLDLVLTTYTSYRALQVVLTGFQPATDGVNFLCRTATDASGVVFDSSSGNYKWAASAYSSAGSSVTGSSSSDTGVQLTTGSATVGNASTKSAEMTLTLYNQTSTSLWTQFSWSGSYLSTSADLIQVSGSGVRTTANDVTGLRFLFSSGNISAGNYAIYGLA